MSRILLIAVIAAIGIGGYYYLNQPEPTPAEQLQSAAEDAGEAVNEAASAAQEAATEALDSAADQAGEAASSLTEQAAEAASSVADQASDAVTQAGDEVASLAGQGQELLNTWVQEGMLTAQQFDYDKMVASVQDSALTQDIKTQVIQILDDIKAAPDTALTKLQDLQNLLTQQ